MINNFLKAVGVDNTNSNPSNDNYDNINEKNTSYATNSNHGSSYSDNESNNFASTIGGLINNFQQQFDGSNKSVDGFVGGGSGGYKNATGGRLYYTDGTVDRRLQQQRREQGAVSSSSQFGTDRQGGQKLKGKQTQQLQPPMMNNGVYQGRKMIPDISDLYNVVNDKAAYDNYDTLMEITSHAATEATERLSSGDESFSSHGGSTNNSRRGRDGTSQRKMSSQEQKAMWARAKEEELVDRMLSQFPEFGTNRPTPFIAFDEDDSDEEDDNNMNDNSSLRQKQRDMSSKKSGVSFAGQNNPAPIEEESANNAAASLYSPTQFFTNDASELLGRFFGMPNNSNANNTSTSKDTTNTSATGVGEGKASTRTGEEFKRSSSFGSSSTLSTMTASAATAANSRKSGNLVSTTPDQSNNFMAEQAVVPDGILDDVGKDYSSVWDQDEIDLWTSSVPSPIPRVASSKMQNHGTSSASRTGSTSTQLKTLPTALSRASSQKDIKQQQQEPSNDDTWASRRRRHRERRKKRQDWDALRELNSSSIAQQPAPVNNAPSLPVTGSQFHPQQTLLAALPDREPPASTVTDNKNKTESTHSEDSQHERGGGGGAVIVDDGKQHWMPDNLCKHCYSCEAPFTLIRRKHHCRVCGMIFCSACSAYFVQISSTDSANGKGTMTDGKSSAGTMRTCNMCYNHLTERGLGVVMRGDMGTVDASDSSMKKQASSLSVDKMAEEGSPVTARPLTRKGSTRDILLPLTTESIPETVEDSKVASITATSSAAELKEQFAGFQGAEGVSVEGDFHALTITKQRLDEEGRRREEQERAEAEAARLVAEEEAAAIAEANRESVEGRPSSFRLKSKLGSSVRQLKWKGSSSNLETKNVEDGGNKFTPETIDAHSDSVVEVSVSVDGEATSGGVSSTIPTTEGIRAVASTLESSSGIEDALFDPGQSNDAKQSAKRHIGTVAADYLEKLGRELLQTDAPLLLEEIKAACIGVSPSIESKLTDLWVNTLMTLSTRCCATVEPDVKSGDLLDIRPYCKVKVIPGGSVEDSAYMSGIVFHKNVSHKRMARVIPNAKIMMLSGGIEYTRTENRIASLDTLLEQEERYMEILVTVSNFTLPLQLNSTCCSNFLVIPFICRKSSS